MLKQKQTNEKVQRDVKLYKADKWKAFRENKHIIVNEYIKLKKKQRSAEALLRLVMLDKFIKVISFKFKEEYRKHEMNIKGLFMASKINGQYRKFARRYG